VKAGLMTKDRLGELLNYFILFFDTDKLARIAATNFHAIRPDFLPQEPNDVQRERLAMTGVPLESYQLYRKLVGPDGIGRLPWLSHLATMEYFSQILDQLENEFARLIRNCGGAQAINLITIAALCGGTGATAARTVGLIFRHLISHSDILDQDARWFHVGITLSVLPSKMRVPRTRALEHRQLLELEELMKPRATLVLPGQGITIEQPGPDDLLLLSSSAGSPRTFEESIDELAMCLDNWLTA